jgi:diguanylate cyclase (GGDEF)-like protein
MEAGTATESAVALGLLDTPRRVVRRVIAFEREWAAAGPALFAGLALALLLYNHVEKQVTDLAFWLGLTLIGTVFVWLLQNNRRQSRLDPVTGLANRLRLQDELRELLAAPKNPHTLVLLELDGLSAYRDRFGFDAGDHLLRRFAWDLREVVARLGGRAYRMEGSQFCALLPNRDRQPGEIVMAISVAAESDQDELPIYRSHAEVVLPADAADPDTALKLAAERLAAHKQRQRASAKRQAQDALVAVLSARRPELAQHLRAVAFRAISIGRILGLSQGQLDDVVCAAKLQNVGLLTVPDAILDKPGALTDAEHALIKGHAKAGARIIASAPALAPVAAIVRSSCEHFDGTGHPDGLAGEAIPLGARIVSVCVAYTALTAERPHRPAYSAGDALGIIRNCAGAQFDPAVVHALADDLVDEIDDRHVA